MAQNSKQKTGMRILWFLALIIAAGLLLPQPLGTLFKSSGVGLALTWLAVAILMLFIIINVGISLNKGRAGILIDPARNMMSLSRLQIVLWTWVVLSAFVTVALARIADSADDPLTIALPPLLWALMGVSVTSAVGSPLLKTAKGQRTEDEDRKRIRIADIRARRGETVELATYGGTLRNRTRDDPDLADRLENEGVLVKKNNWSDAMFSDVFMGEEVSNFMYVDVAKVQNFFFTAVAGVSYVVALVAEMMEAGGASGFSTFPDLPVGLMAVISISHAGYLTDKAFPHSTPEEASCRWKGKDYDHGHEVTASDQRTYTCTDGKWFRDDGEQVDPPDDERKN